MLPGKIEPRLFMYLIIYLFIWTTGFLNNSKLRLSVSNLLFISL